MQEGPFESDVNYPVKGSATSLMVAASLGNAQAVDFILDYEYDEKNEEENKLL